MYIYIYIIYIHTYIYIYIYPPLFFQGGCREMCEIWAWDRLKLLLGLIIIIYTYIYIYIYNIFKFTVTPSICCFFGGGVIPSIYIYIYIYVCIYIHIIYIYIYIYIYTDKTSLRLIRRIGGGGKGPHWIDIGFTLDSLVKGFAS